jgi:hypothetical protein
VPRGRFAICTPSATRCRSLLHQQRPPYDEQALRGAGFRPCSGSPDPLPFFSLPLAALWAANSGCKAVFLGGQSRLTASDPATVHPRGPAHNRKPSQRLRTPLQARLKPRAGSSVTPLPLNHLGASFDNRFSGELRSPALARVPARQPEEAAPRGVIDPCRPAQPMASLKPALQSACADIHRYS